MQQHSSVRDFLGCKRIAFVGVSSDPKDFSRALFREWAGLGYDLVPVNPFLDMVEGQPCHPSVRDIPGGVEAAFIITPPRMTDGVVEDCLQAGVPRVWMHRGAGAGSGAVSESAVAACRAKGVDVVAGACPLMFFEGTGFVHRLHGAVLSLLGRRPA